MDKTNLENRLKELEDQRKEYDFIVQKLFNHPLLLTDAEKEQFMQENKEKIKDLEKISKEIGEIRFHLISPQEQKDYTDKYS